jgi:hypothetical protein
MSKIVKEKSMKLLTKPKVRKSPIMYHPNMKNIKLLEGGIKKLFLAPVTIT